THGDVPRVDRSAQATAVLDGNGDALVPHAVEHRIGDEVAHGAFHGAADLARALDRGGGDTDHAGLELFERQGQFGDAIDKSLIRHDVRIEQDWGALGRDDLAVVIPGDLDLAEILAVLAGLHD